MNDTKTTKRTALEITNALQYFTGTECWYRHGLVPRIVYTEGVQFVAEHCGAYWLLDEIALHNQFTPAVKAAPFQVWKLTVRDNKASLVCEDGNDIAVFGKMIEFTDFPLPEIVIWCTDNTMLLPSEY